MDSLIAAAARALAAGDALGALKRVALREDPSALALRGIAMAQLGEHPRARELLRQATRGFGRHEALARARCIVAEAEVALAMREFSGSPRSLAAAATALESRGDHANALQARLIAVRRLLLLGRLDEAAAGLSGIDAHGQPPALVAIERLLTAELALRSLRVGPAREALNAARAAAATAGVPPLQREVDEALATLDQPAARRIVRTVETTLRLDEVETLLVSDTLVIDACRHGLRHRGAWLPLASRPVLFALLRALAGAWPGDVPREALIERVFRTRRPDETHRARLRVEIGRLRALLQQAAHIVSTRAGYLLQPIDAADVAVLAPPFDGDPAALLALLSDGAAWSSSALALALDISQRSVQRALAELEAAGHVRCIGRTRARRWLAPSRAGFTTILLLPAMAPNA